ncbi:MAG: hypothetical protein AB7D07_08255 [Desulfovibrionaceae bacterium]
MKEEAYDASVLDMETPVMSGLGAIKRIRRGEAGPATRISPSWS